MGGGTSPSPWLYRLHDPLYSHKVGPHTPQISFLCLYTYCAYIPAPPNTGLYFTLNGTVYLPGDTIPITDIGSK